MRSTRLAFFLTTVVAALIGVAACGDDDDNTVRLRSEGGATFDAPVETSTEGGGPGFLTCGVMIPTTYESPSYATNAKVELDLRKAFGDLGAKIMTAEGAGMAAVTSAELDAIFKSGTPSLRSIATAGTQATVDNYITQFGAAVGKTWTPADADVDGGAAAGGKYENANLFSPIGVDFREGIAKTLLGGALYNHALALTNGAISEATIDSLVAVFGATPKFASRTDADAAADEKDELVAEYASQRDNKASTTLGPYRKVKNALLVAKAAATNTEKCRADLDAALKIYFLEWEKVSYLTVIFFLNAAATDATANPVKGAAALHSFGAALGFIQSFKGIPQDRRKITDVQIDKLLAGVGGTTPYKLITDTSARVVAFNAAYQDIGVIYSLTPTEIEDAKKAY